MFRDSALSALEERALKFLFSEVKYLKGVGPVRGSILNQHKIKTVIDLLYYVPRRYLDRTNIKHIRDLETGETATVVGKVASFGVTRGRTRRFLVYIQDETSHLELVWFSGFKYLENMFAEGDVISVTGKVGFYDGPQMSHPEFEMISGIDDDEPIHTRRIIPLYPESAELKRAKLHSRGLRKIIKPALAELRSVNCETLPAGLRARFGLPGLVEAISQVHFPDSMPAADEGTRRLAFEELFYLELLLAAKHHKRTTHEPGNTIPPPIHLGRELLNKLNFQLTRAQKRVLNQIYHDMGEPHPMNRLLQGDVGSGKTVVALLAMLGAVEAGHQAALLAPTEVLVEQHGYTLEQMLDGLGIEIAVFTGSASGAKRDSLLRSISQGDAKIVIGTHTLIQEKLKFKNLAFCVIDEQHKFGVVQRGKLKGKGTAPDILVMTATPIPRTLAMTVYGDLDVSVIDEMPPGRRPVKTSFVRPEKRADMYEFIREQMKQGKQAYVVYPLVKESEKTDLRSAAESHEGLRRQVFPEFRLALLHGRMKGADKSQVMLAFKDHKIDLIVATTVIEVGLDVANANIMVIEHAERYGLSQLHQLRGRIGRGEHQSYCMLLSDQPLSKDAEARIKVICSTNDGFKIAEADMSLRGPGEIMGTRQHGLPELKIANLMDSQLLSLARQSAFEIISGDELLIKPGNRLLREVLIRKFEKKIQYSKIA